MARWKTSLAVVILIVFLAACGNPAAGDVEDLAEKHNLSVVEYGLVVSSTTDAGQIITLSVQKTERVGKAVQIYLNGVESELLRYVEERCALTSYSAAGEELISGYSIKTSPREGGLMLTVTNTQDISNQKYFVLWGFDKDMLGSSKIVFKA